MNQIRRFFTWILSMVQGKKTSIASIVGALIIFAVGRDYIEKDTAELLAVILATIGISSNVGTARLIYGPIHGPQNKND